MKLCKLDALKQEELIKKIQAFFKEERHEALDHSEASRLLRFMLQETGHYLYDQALEESRFFLAQKLENILGIKKDPVH